MKRLWTVAAATGSAALAALSFMANQSASEVQSNIQSYTDNPLVRALPGWLSGIATSNWFLAISFFALGCVATTLVGRWRNGSGSLTYLEDLAERMKLTADTIDATSGDHLSPSALADLTSAMTDLRQRGFAIPPVVVNPIPKDKVSYYLHFVAGEISRGDVRSAKAKAQLMVNTWVRTSPSARQAGGQ